MNRKAFYDGVRSGPFPGALTHRQVQGMEFILDEWERRKLSDLRHLAYILATAYHETAHTMEPIHELGGDAYLRRKKYYPWYGRGYVQLTWKPNYLAFQKEVKNLFGVDIVENPNNAMIPKVAAYIMFEGMYRGTFTGKSLNTYTTPSGFDWVNARRIINGTDRAQLIAGYAKQFYVDLTTAKE